MANKQELIRANLVNVRNDNPKVSVDYISEDTIKKVNDFHKSFDEYSVTPLHNLGGLANHFGVKNIFLKDES